MEDKVREIVGNALKARDLELVDLEIRRGRAPLVRVFIDKEGGVTAADCSEVTRELSVHFMVEEAIPQDTLIEVSSPGMERPFRTLRDYERNRGREVEVRHLSAGREILTVGLLEEVGPGGLRLQTGRGPVDVSLDSIKTAKQHIPF